MDNNININSLDLSQKIKNEKRRRNQIYTALDYLRSHKNKFDFFSYDSIKIFKTSKELTKAFKQQKVTSEILLLSFFNSNSEILKIFNKFNISFSQVEKAILYAYNLESLKNNEIKKIQILPKFLTNFSKPLKYNTEISDYNFEVKLIIEKAIENAFRFKTPVITSEILFLTILEDKNSSAGQLLKTLLATDLEWNLIRYEILKKLHNQETKVQGTLDKSLRYFAYLLKIELDDTQFEKLLQKTDFASIILNYRDLIISKVLEVDIFKEIEKDIKLSIKTNNKRKYSF
jgi:ATP-dependent Clp protease ATP-binding subunit ClpA